MKIKLFIFEDKTTYSFCVQDNGPVIDSKHHKKLFDLFETDAPVDKYGKSGNGIGLATVKGLIDTLGGTIILKSGLEKGVQFFSYYQNN
ncbi:MAG: signal transduction histidine kinase [Sphingobacteriales bacterium]